MKTGDLVLVGIGAIAIYFILKKTGVLEDIGGGGGGGGSILEGLQQPMQQPAPGAPPPGSPYYKQLMDNPAALAATPTRSIIRAALLSPADARGSFIKSRGSITGLKPQNVQQAMYAKLSPISQAILKSKGFVLKPVTVRQGIYARLSPASKAILLKKGFRG